MKPLFTISRNNKCTLCQIESTLIRKYSIFDKYCLNEYITPIPIIDNNTSLKISQITLPPFLQEDYIKILEQELQNYITETLNKKNAK